MPHVVISCMTWPMSSLSRLAPLATRQPICSLVSPRLVSRSSGLVVVGVAFGLVEVSLAACRDPAVIPIPSTDTATTAERKVLRIPRS